MGDAQIAAQKVYVDLGLLGMIASPRVAVDLPNGKKREHRMTDQHLGSSPKIGIVGDRNDAYPTHRATDEALAHVPAPLPCEWLSTERAMGMRAEQLGEYAGFLIAPGSPYQSTEGALRVIRFARESGVPLLGTCGGFQHVVVESVRNVLGVPDAGHEETEPTAAHLAVTALSCSLVGQQQTISFLAGSQVAAIYDETEAVEAFYCSFGLNPAYRLQLQERGLRVTGIDRDGEARVLELVDHPFYLATLYVPQVSSIANAPHPLVAAFVEAAHHSRSAIPVSA